MKRTKGLLSKLIKSRQPAMPQPLLPHLAQELIDRIVDAVAGSYPNDYLAGKALRKCSIVNKAFLPRCRMHLFKVVKFTAQHSNTLRMQRLLTLIEHPLSQIAPYIHTLHLRDAFWEPGLPTILRFLSDLRCIHLEMRAGTASWTAFSPTLSDALLKTAALGSLEEISLRNLTEVPSAFLGLARNLQRLVIRETTLEVEEDASVPGEDAARFSQLTALSVRGEFSHFLPLFSSPTTSLRPRLSDVQLVARSHEDVAAYTYFLRLSSRTIEKLSVSNRSGEQNFTFPGVPSISTHHRRRDTTYQSR